MSENKSDNVVVLPHALPRKTAPKAQPLMPGEEERDDRLVESFNKGGLVPSVDMDDPDVKAAQSAYEAAQAKLQQTIRRKAMLKMVSETDSLDPARVQELCAAEPWNKGGLDQLNKALMGFVPEKFEARAETFPAGSDDYKLYRKAAEEAAGIYWQQLKTELRKTCAKFDNDASAASKRALYEPLSSRLWNFAQSLRDNPLYTQQYGRVMWMAMNLGEEYMNKYGKDKAGGPGYQQWRIALRSEQPEPAV